MWRYWYKLGLFSCLLSDKKNVERQTGSNYKLWQIMLMIIMYGNEWGLLPELIFSPGKPIIILPIYNKDLVSSLLRPWICSKFQVIKHIFYRRKQNKLHSIEIICEFQMNQWKNELPSRIGQSTTLIAICWMLIEMWVCH